MNMLWGMVQCTGNTFVLCANPFLLYGFAQVTIKFLYFIIVWCQIPLEVFTSVKRRFIVKRSESYGGGEEGIVMN